MNHAINLDVPGLRKFGLMTGLIVVALFGLTLPLVLGRHFPVWPWVIAGPLWALGLAIPKALGPVYRIWMRFGAVMGVINSTIILAVIFFFLITPIGLVMRLFGRNPLAPMPSRSSSFRVVTNVRPAKHMERPY